MTIMVSDGDTAATADAFELWLRHGDRAGAHATVLSFQHASAENGFSNDTFIATIAPRPGVPIEKVILRMPPQGEGLFDAYDVEQEYRLMDGLSRSPGLPMARCRWLERLPAALGRPFFVVDFVEGKIAQDRPMTYIHEGWIADASADERAQLWRTTLDSLVALSAVDPYQTGIADWPNPARLRVSQHLDLWHRRFKWGGGLDQTMPTVVHDLRAWLDANLPDNERVGLVWGDARLGNIIFRDFRPAALLDWELAVVGDPEMDLAYFLFIHDLYVAEADLYQRPLASMRGFMSQSESIAYYEQKSGLKVRQFRFYYLFNLYRIMAVTQRLASLFVMTGAMTQEEAYDMRWLRWSWPLIEREIGSSG